MERNPLFFMLRKHFFMMIFLFFLIPATPTLALEDHHNVLPKLLEGERILKERSFVKNETPTVYLTFDDGPSKLTPQVLDILKTENVKATFFVLGQLAESKKDLVKRINDEGHSIGNHTYSHKYNKLYTSFSTYWQEIQKTEDILEEIIGYSPSIVRTPGGTYKNWDPFYFFYMDQADYLIYDWNIDSGDSKRVGVPSNEIIQNVKKAKLNNKLILLMHDGNGHEYTVKALPEIIHYFKGKGYQFSILTEKVEPIVHPNIATRWERENEFEKRSMFVRTAREIEFVKNTEKITRIQQKNFDDLLSAENTRLLVSAETTWEKVKPKSIKYQISMLIDKITQVVFSFPMLFNYNE